MPFFAPVPLIRHNHIIKQLIKAGATSPETAVTLEQAGVMNPNRFKPVRNIMLKRGELCAVGDKYYVDLKRARFSGA